MSAPKGNQNAKGNKGGGRKTTYKKEYARIAGVLCRLGAIDKEIAEALGCGITSLNKWKKVHLEFGEALKRDKKLANKEVERSLYERATGYSCEEEKIFNNNGKALIVKTIKRYPPETAACIFWLKNRDKNNWRDKPEGTDAADGIAEALKEIAENLPT